LQRYLFKLRFLKYEIRNTKYEIEIEIEITFK
jgi:hypothetical protein